MSRRDFGRWGVDLSDDDFTCALAAAGVVAAIDDRFGLLSRDSTSAQIASILTTAAGLELLPWEQPRARDVASLPASHFSDAWRQLSGRHRIEVRSPHSDPIWVLRRLASDVVAGQSVYARVDRPSVEVGWEWPLTVGVLNDRPSEALRADLESACEAHSSWLPRVVRIAKAAVDRDKVDILLLPYNIDDALRAALTHRPPLRADCTIVLGTGELSTARTWTYLQALRTAVRTAGVVLTTVSAESRGPWFAALMRNLSHNLPIDVAMFQLDRTSTMVLSRPLARYARLADYVRRMSRAMARPESRDLTMRIEPGSMAARAISNAGTLTMGEVASRLEAVPEERLFDHESDMSVGAVDIAAAAAPMLEEVARPAEPRFIQGQVFGDGPQPLDRFAAGAGHTIAVRIGPLESSWLADASEAFPEHELPPDRDEHELAVTLSEPRLLTEVQTATLLLPRSGASRPCTFRLHVPAAARSVDARITVSHGNRILQTARLKGPVGTHFRAERIRVEVEGVARASLADLNRRPRFDAALLVNHDGDNVPRVLRLASNHASLVTDAGIDDEIKWLDDRLSAVAQNRQAFDGGLGAEATVDLLRSFARHGALLYRALVKEGIGEGALAGERRIQIISAHRDARLPAEFVYERRAPQPTAPLCPNAERSLAEGHCGSDCPAGAAEDTVVCPLGFWGLSKVIERHAFNPAAANALIGRTFAIQAEPVEGRDTLKLLEGALLAASQRVNAACQGAVDRLVAQAAGLVRRAPAAATGWPEWIQHVAGESNSMLLLLVHTRAVADDDPEQMMEIGQDSWLASSNIGPEHVRPDDQHPSPIVLLFGCETAAPKNALLSLVSGFRVSGAAIVVSTGSTIHSLHAVPVVEAFLEEIDRTARGATAGTFGEVMRTVRRRMLARGLPMVLCVTAFGDADWRITA